LFYFPPQSDLKLLHSISIFETHSQSTLIIWLISLKLNNSLVCCWLGIILINIIYTLRYTEITTRINTVKGCGMKELNIALYCNERWINRLRRPPLERIPLPLGVFLFIYFFWKRNNKTKRAQHAR
jgi:hypothetical protein